MTLTRFVRALGATTLVGGLLLAGVPAASADQVRDAQWPNKYFDLDKVWSVSKGDGVIVAVIDSGVEANHQDLSGSVLPGYDPDGEGLNTNPTDPHGTGMAGLIVGHGHGSREGALGLAPGAKVLPIFKSSEGHRDAVPEDIRWAVDHNAKVINISLASDNQNAKLADAVSYAAQHDVLIVAGSGNDGGHVLSPANEPGVLAVGAVDKTNAIWNKSSYGPEIMLTAPGVDIVSTGPCDGGQYCIGDGTSNATAYVSAAAALVRAKFPKLTAGQVANRLIKSALVPSALKGAKLPDTHYGYGILRPYEALTQDIPTGPAQGPLAKPTGAVDGSATTQGGVAPTGATPDSPTPPKLVSSGKSTSGLMIGAGIGLVVLIVLVVVIILVARRKKTPPPAPPAPHGGQPGWQPQQPQYPGQYQQQPPYPNQPYGNQAPPQGYPLQQPYQNPYNQGGNDQR
ncbi:S8 family serine peptidase [Kitasatospora sp. MMS16-BH015]|uniref:S8 family serine peptidase n=1 Tax=Kitasatospora sp. MMS16-BH015 TaxID=2018025 RepID=UPI000CF2CF37|nr:S8 family serine peptidase [Kitasatospora sp. MMS16-BH015]